MISQEFKVAVEARNLLKARIMMKDAFLTDPTFAQLDEMLHYVKAKLPAVCIVPYDGAFLEPDSSKWNRDTMNSELVDLVDNFSETRIVHLKKVVTKVMAPKITKNQSQRTRTTYATQDSATLKKTREQVRDDALAKIRQLNADINSILQEITSNKRYSYFQIDRIEKKAAQIQAATNTIKSNMP